MNISTARGLWAAFNQAALRTAGWGFLAICAAIAFGVGTVGPVFTIEAGLDRPVRDGRPVGVVRPGDRVFRQVTYEVHYRHCGTLRHTLHAGSAVIYLPDIGAVCSDPGRYERRLFPIPIEALEGVPAGPVIYDSRIDYPPRHPVLLGLRLPLRIAPPAPAIPPVRFRWEPEVDAP